MPQPTYTLGNVVIGNAVIGEAGGLRNREALELALFGEPFEGLYGNIDRGLTWSATPQRGTTFWSDEHEKYYETHKLSDNARTILKAWFGMLPEWPQYVSEMRARQVMNPASSRTTRAEALINIGPWGEIPHPPGMSSSAWSNEHTRLTEGGGPDELCAPLANLIRSWYGLDPLPEAVAGSPPAASAEAIDPPWVLHEERKYADYHGHMVRYIAEGHSEEKTDVWFPGDDSDDERYAASDPSDEAEAMRKASPSWPRLFAERRNLVRAWALRAPMLPLPEVPVVAGVARPARKPAKLKRVSIEARKEQYPAINGATAGCDCAECKKLRKGFEAVNPLDFASDEMKRAALDYQAKGRTFGVEIEFYAPNSQAARDLDMNSRQYVGVKLGEQGLRVYTHEHPERWSVKSDASLSERPADHEGIEVTSPVLRGEAGLTEIAKACAAINAAGAKVNKTCGLHVHVGAKDLTLRQRVNLASQFIRYERFFDLILPESRRANRYAASLRKSASATGTTSTKAAEHAILKLMEVSCEEEMNRIALWDNHHARLADAREKHGTFEFRQHSGTTNAEKIVNWVRLVTAFVEVAKDKPALPFYSRKLSDEEEMEKFFETFAIARDLRAYYRKRHAALFKDPTNDE